MNFFGYLRNSILPTPLVVCGDLCINIPFTGRGGARGWPAPPPIFVQILEGGPVIQEPFWVVETEQTLQQILQSNPFSPAELLITVVLLAMGDPIILVEWLSLSPWLSPWFLLSHSEKEPWRKTMVYKCFNCLKTLKRQWLHKSTHKRNDNMSCIMSLRQLKHFHHHLWARLWPKNVSTSFKLLFLTTFPGMNG